VLTDEDWYVVLDALDYMIIVLDKINPYTPDLREYERDVYQFVGVIEKIMSQLVKEQEDYDAATDLATETDRD
jgi:hypothetical protein